jgi:hypothetical protein
MLYLQPDFNNVPSILEKLYKHCGYQVLFLPKFHCKVNFIEQCGGFVKHIYHQFLPSSKDADLELNLVAALDSVPLKVMCWSVKFVAFPIYIMY